MTKVQWNINVDGNASSRRGFVQGYVFIPNSGVHAVITTPDGKFLVRDINDIIEVKHAG